MAETRNKLDRPTKFKVDERVRVLPQKPGSNWANGRTGRVYEIIEFTDFDPEHEPGDCYLVQLDDPAFPGQKVGLMKTVMNAAGQEKTVVRTYPFSEVALEAE